MKIAISQLRAASLAQLDMGDNPVIAWDNVIAAGTVYTGQATSQTDGAAANAVTGTTYDYWSAVPLSTLASINSDAGSGNTFTAGFGAIAAHNLGSLGATAALQYSTDGVSYLDCGAGSIAPEDDDPIGWYFETTAARYWRVLVSGVTTSDVVSVGVWVVAPPLIIPSRIYQGYAPPLTPTEVEMESNVSQGGHLLGSKVVKRGSSAKATLTLLPRDFVRSDDWLGFQAHCNDGKGFFWAWRPTTHDDLFYAWGTGPVVPANSGPHSYMSADIGMRLYHG